MVIGPYLVDTLKEVTLWLFDNFFEYLEEIFLFIQDRYIIGNLLI